MAREIIFDTETTGFSPREGDRITEIGCVEVIDLIPTGREYHTYVNPQRDIPARVTEVTGLTREFLADKPLFNEVCADFLEFVGDARLVAHNAPFDREFINFELERAGHPRIIDDRFFCTLIMAREKYPGIRASLDALCERFRISLESRDVHGAVIDARLLAAVYLELNGGRERRLDIFNESGRASRVAADPAKQRPAPLGSFITEPERAAHKAFIEELGEDSLWSLYA